MDIKLEKALRKILVNETYFTYFNNAKIDITTSPDDIITINITNEVPLPYFLYKEILDKFNNYFSNNNINLNIKVNKIDNTYIKDYYKEIINYLSNDKKIIMNFIDSINNDNDKYFIEVQNKAEANQINKFTTNINDLLTKVGFSPLEVIINKTKNEETINNINKDLDTISKIDITNITNAKAKTTTTESNSLKYSSERKKAYHNIPTEDNENVFYGRLIKDEPVSIKSIVGEEDSVTVDVCVFGVVEFEPVNKDFKLLTLKITDYTDSIYAKVFIRDMNQFEKLKKQSQPGTHLRIRGSTKIDKYANNELVINVRDINKLEVKKETRIDTAEEKRVELHTHTLMSQMDGLCDPAKLIKTAKSWGHKAIAVTDHDGCQAFPDLYHTVCSINKSIENEEDKFKVIYGTELTLIDDNVDIVLRPTDANLLNSTYVVFDFETTGFNAGGEDSIIEVGAVKLKDGEIIERFDELIDPKHPLNPRITELTGITDEMLQGKNDEKTVIGTFLNWVGDLPLVAHNAKFDSSFLDVACIKYGYKKVENPLIDTLELSRTLDNSYGRHSLSAIVKRYDVDFDESSHHRGDYDAEATALVFYQMMKKLHTRSIDKISDLDLLVSKDEIYKYGNSYHVNILVKNKTGLKNLFKIISYANTKYFYKGTARILRSVLNEHREGLLIGSGCYESEVFRQAKSKVEDELTNIVSFYDYVEIQPPSFYKHLIQTSDFGNELELTEHLKKIIRVTKYTNKIIVATGDVHHIENDDKIYREILINQKVPGGLGRHPLSKNSIKDIPSMYLKTTDEMLKDFAFLGDDLSKEIVITNTNKIADMVDIIEVIIETGGIPFSPKIENSKQTTMDLVYNKAHSIYGDPLPELIDNRIKQELDGIFKGGFDVIYLIAQKLVKKSNDDGYLVGSRGSVGSSFVATMMGITEVNPLPAHYVCPKCKTSIFEQDGKPLSMTYSSGYDLPNLKCPNCGENMNKEGQDMPFATFLGFNADKVPDIDLNFSGDYQWKAHEYTKELFGVDNVYRAGTIGTVADKTAFGYVRGYLEEKEITNTRFAEIERLAIGCTGVKRTTGQHPGGIVVIPAYMDVYDFTPYQYPAGDTESLWRTTHFDYHAIDQDVLKLDILGHDDPTILKMLSDLSGIDVTKLPMDDQSVISLLTSPKALGVTEEQIMCPTGTLGLPELGTNFVIAMLTETKPKTFAELVKISGLSHGTDVWAGNASELIRNNVVPFKEVIGCRDDIMVYLMKLGMDPLDSFKIMEFVRKGKASKDKETWEKYEAKMKEANVPEWFIDSCHKIKYMFPKAHACAYVISAFRIAWFKIYKPRLYYAAFFSIRSTDFELETMMKGYDAIKKRLDDLKLKGYDATNKESNIIETLSIALEATARGIKFANIDITKSMARDFILDENDENTLIPPFRTLDGLGIAVGNSIVEERNKREFMSIEDILDRCKISAPLLEKLRSLKVLDNYPESSQLTLF